MKKIILYILSVLLIGGGFAGCAGVENTENKGLSIVCASFPEYDWTRRIVGDKPSDTELTLLIKNGVDMHSFQPSTDDIIKISTCDVFIYTGGESQAWVKDALKQSVNKNMTVINLLEVLGDAAKEEQEAEGMQSEEAHNHEHEAEYDEHIWLSLKNADILCRAIAKKLGEADKGNKALYERNVKAYISELDTLGGEYESTVRNAAHKTLIFGDRFPFRYLCDDYALSYYAAFSGCSAETEASFPTIIFLSGKVDELGLNAVIKIDGTSHQIAETVVGYTTAKNQKILTLNSFQSVTQKQIDAGLTYISMMRDNLGVLKEALS